MEFPRSSGILLHPTSLPGKYGIGDLGPSAYAFADFLKLTGQTIWQVLPLGPTSFGDSPYQATSSFAGNPLLICLDKLMEAGWLTEEDLPPASDFNDYVVNYGPVIEYHFEALNRSFAHFNGRASSADKAKFQAFCKENADWLDDYALFAALKDSNDGRPWWEWPTGQALRDPDEITAAKQALEENVQSHMYRQWLFFSQWQPLREYVNAKGIRLMGDIPIFVAHDSADVWSSREFFYLDEETALPTVVAGVPPDYFSATGQRWGNPLYKWDVMKADGYQWWKKRLSVTLKLYDLVRIDHFRGFDTYWEVPAEEETAVKGRWMKGPGSDFFKAMKKEFGTLPIVAEDLGFITQSVYDLRDEFGFPGMKILQFAFDETGQPNNFQPHTYTRNCVVYTGTHDNNTTLGWWNESSDKIRRYAQAYAGIITDPPRDLARLAMMSVADTVIIPLQDVLGYGGDTRMNFPGIAAGNWAWRFHPDALNDQIRLMLGDMTYRYDRWPMTEEERKARSSGSVHGSV